MMNYECSVDGENIVLSRVMEIKMLMSFDITILFLRDDMDGRTDIPIVEFFLSFS